MSADGIGVHDVWAARKCGAERDRLLSRTQCEVLISEGSGASILVDRQHDDREQ